MEKNDKPSTEQQQLAWSQEIPNYGDKLLKRLEEFRKTTILYDVRVRAEGGEFNAHKIILAACGGMFRTCFIDESKKMISSSITELKLNCPAQGLKPIIKFAYTGALIVTKRNAVATMIAAEVTKMREVQEICADIALKEYGWIISFTDEKNSAVVEKLQNVLSAHASCFKSLEEIAVAQWDDNKNLPFLEDIRSSFPDSVETYQKLAVCLSGARTLINNNTKSNEAPDAESENSGKNVSEPVLEAKSPLKRVEIEEPVTNGAPDNVDSGKPQVTLNNEKEISTQQISPKPADSVKNVPAWPPVRKPRSSVKTKAAPPPPSPRQREVAPKSPAALPPPRPQKLPTKVPPPRPKPPAVKTISAEDGNSSNNDAEVDYDDSLNPFA
ncbi:uncharacterized protein LOC120336389 [Styela clava]